MKFVIVQSKFLDNQGKNRSLLKPHENLTKGGGMTTIFTEPYLMFVV